MANKDILHHSRLHDALGKLLALADDGLPPFCVAVCDATGDLVAFLKMENAPRRVADIAKAKARTAAMMETTTRSLHERLVRENLTLADFCASGFTSIAGGFPLKMDGQTLGGVGVSGRTPEQDEEMAQKLLSILTQM